MSTPPIVSVIAACYNHARFVIECLESIRAQTYPYIQLIITDDASRDNSVELIEGWLAQHEVEATFIRNGKNQGLCRTLNAALGVSKGDYVAIIATDDVWLPERLDVQVRALENSPPDVGLIYGDAYCINENGELQPDTLIQARRPMKEMPEGDVFPTLVRGNFIPPVTAMMRRSVLDRVGQFDERLSYEDWDMWLRISQHYKIAFCPTITAKYRLVGTSMSRTVLQTQNSSVFATNYLILSKCLDHPALTPELERMIRNELSGLCKLQLVVHELSCFIPRGSSYLLAEPYPLPVWADPSRKPIPFVERDGQYWGPPADDATAIEELERMRREGTGYFAIAWPSFWWLESYPGFFEYLRRTFRCLHQSDYTLVFQL